MSYNPCKNPRCDGSYYLCGKCRKQFPQAAKMLDERKRELKRSRPANASFQGQPATVDQGNTGRKDRMDIYYGGAGTPGGPGHGHVVVNDGENVELWRLPGQDKGEEFMDYLRSDPYQ